ncbi:hypothetical protein [Acidocella sp.]|uniref:hypothetical protein n=1 Tax=Acidocella sp. TaxID=50710 RepID=UPI002623EA7E|nr:hypothetical protein [Acidocella sp.]
MTRATDNGASRAAPAGVMSLAMMAEPGPPVAELAGAAIMRFRGDLETCLPGKPALAYALADETHAAMLKRWRRYPQDIQEAILAAFLEETCELLHQIQARTELTVAHHGHMFGMQEEVVRLETQADITLEEVHRIERDLAALRHAKECPEGPDEAG